MQTLPYLTICSTKAEYNTMTTTITDVQGKADITDIFNDCSLVHNYYLCKLSDCCSVLSMDISPSVQICREAVEDHPTTTQHKGAIQLEMMQRISTFQKQVNKKKTGS